MRSRPAAAGVALGALVAASALVRGAAALQVPVPWIAPDEFLYGLVGRSLWAGDGISVLGEPVAFNSLVHPALVGLPLAALGVETGYEVAKLLQALVMSCAAVAVYLWARALVPVPHALLAAALTLLVPGLAYSGLLMTETVFYPALVLAAWAAARVLERPTLRGQALLLGALALALATRVQAVVLVPALVTALALDALAARSLTRTRALLPTLGAFLALAGATVAVQLARGESLAGALGAYRSVAETGYGAGAALEHVWLHAAMTVLLAGLAPVLAVGLLALPALRGREPDAGVRALVLVTVSLWAWFVLQVGVFASAHSPGRVQERYLLPLAPLAFLAFAVWLARGAPRRHAVAAPLAVAGASAVALFPFARHATESNTPDSPTLAAVRRLLESRPELDPALLASVAAAAVAALFVLLPRRGIVALPALLAVLFAAGSVAASRQFVDESELRRARLLGPNATWIERDGARPVAYLYDGDDYWNAVWAQVFWNPSVERVYSLPGTKVPGAMPQRTWEPAPDGSLGVSEPFVVTTTAFELTGDRVAETAIEGAPHAGLVLWRAGPRARVERRLVGVQWNGDMYGSAHLLAYGCRPGTLGLTFLGKKDHVEVVVRHDTREIARETVAPDGVWSVELPIEPRFPPGRGLCRFDIEPSGFVGSTRIEYLD